MAELILPCWDYRESVLDALAEFQSEGLNLEWNLAALQTDFSILLNRLEQLRTGIDLPEEAPVRMTQLWLIDEGKYIGRCHIRHHLTDALRVLGGHIGYQIRPTERRKGYGRLILQLALLEARKLGIDRALITCDARNIPSRRIIEANGGIIDCAETEPELKFWIENR